VTFRLAAPKAAEVSLGGEFMTGTKAFHKDGRGVRSVPISPIEREIYNYVFTIDGVKTIDSADPNVKTGSAPSAIAGTLDVPRDRPRFCDGQPVRRSMRTGIRPNRWTRCGGWRSARRPATESSCKPAIRCSTSFAVPKPTRARGAAPAIPTWSSTTCSPPASRNPS
jgi:hypothetical protein